MNCLLCPPGYIDRISKDIRNRKRPPYNLMVLIQSMLNSCTFSRHATSAPPHAPSPPSSYDPPSTNSTIHKNPNLNPHRSRTALYKSFSAHNREHYPDPTISIIPTDADSTLAILLAANKYSPSNFWYRPPPFPSPAPPPPLTSKYPHPGTAASAPPTSTAPPRAPSAAR